MDTHPTHKRCCTCGGTKPLADFNRLTKANDGRQPSCRDCNKAYHYANWERHMSQIRERRRRQRAINRAHLIDHFRTHPCVDCGETDLLVLEFDHLRDKVANISRLMLSHSTRRIDEEIAKCDVVCANCHRRRTSRRQLDNYRVKAIDEAPEEAPEWAAPDSDRDKTA